MVRDWRTSAGQTWTVTRLCLANLTTAWAILVVAFAVVTVPSVVQIMQAGEDEYFENSYLLSSGNALYLLLVVVPIVVATRHILQVMHLNAAKEVFLGGAAVLYALLAASVAATNYAFYRLLDQPWSQTFQVVNVAEVFGWTGNGSVIAFLQQFVFLLVVALGVHCLASTQRTWSGWSAVLVLVVLFSASLAIEPLAVVRRWLLDLLILHDDAPVQIGACLVAITTLFVGGLVMLRRREL